MGRKCSVCGELSDCVYKCDSCGKPFHGDNDAAPGRGQVDQQ
ncbi:hypothetical protein SAMN05192561_11234 [Halopenitus malekzadehii]|uniref:Uncharacterized protein n=1 Tax=Halopenitus malekzadehii TaxID=1267564 RepID=A0A1H6JNW2_9EURY|nr:hypothetical protein SAMN05192561_11234 [Halopenitus malekzadehii]